MDFLVHKPEQFCVHRGYIFTRYQMETNMNVNYGQICPQFFGNIIVHDLWTKLFTAVDKFVHNDVHKIVHRAKSPHLVTNLFKSYEHIRLQSYKHLSVSKHTNKFADAHRQFRALRQGQICVHLDVLKIVSILVVKLCTTFMQICS